MSVKDLEGLARALQTHLQSKLGATLDSEESRWAETDPLTMDDPNTWVLGVDLSRYFLDYQQGDFPVVSVLAVRMEGDKMGKGLADQFTWQGVTAVAFVDFCVQADSVEGCAKLGWRYGQAIVAALQQSSTMEKWRQVYPQPDMGYQPVSRQIDEDATQDEFYHTQVGRVEVMVVR